MRISIICFSLTGYMTAEDLQKDLQGKGYTVELYKKSKYLDDSIAESTGVWTGRHFETDDAIIFVGACGIAVRSIAPYVASKKSDRQQQFPPQKQDSQPGKEHAMNPIPQFNNTDYKPSNKLQV